MNVVTLCVLTAALVRSVVGVLPLPERSYKILMLIPYWGRSHKIVFMPLAEALADRGHKVVMFTTIQDSHKHPNITEINYVLPNMNSDSINLFDYTSDSKGALAELTKFLPAVARNLYQAPYIKKLYGSRKQFDLIVVNQLFSEVVYPFLHEVPFITLATVGMDPRQSAVLGNVLSPSYAPNLWTSYPLPMSFWHRIKNTFMHVWLPLYWTNSAVLPLVQKEIAGQFPDLPPLLEIERNQSLTLMNTHFTVNTPVPLLPSQVEVGALHCRPAKPLPQELASWITGAGSAGVIYFSLGSIARSESMPLKYHRAFLEAFRRLPYRVLWKHEEKLEGTSDNVRVMNWLPQQDVLAHDNVKVFISHGGLLSLQESIFHATPLLVLPLFGDHPRNGMFVYNAGLGHMLEWEELNADRIVDAVTDIITKPKYKENVARMSESLRDQLTTPQERAVFWTEYVIRHRGAPQLRCPAAQLSWVEFLLMDVVGLLLVTLLVLIILLYRLLKTTSAVLFGGYAKKKTD